MLVIGISLFDSLRKLEMSRPIVEFSYRELVLEDDADADTTREKLHRWSSQVMDGDAPIH